MASIKGGEGLLREPRTHSLRQKIRNPQGSQRSKGGGGAEERLSPRTESSALWNKILEKVGREIGKGTGFVCRSLTV